FRVALPTTRLFTLSLHDALPILGPQGPVGLGPGLQPPEQRIPFLGLGLVHATDLAIHRVLEQIDQPLQQVADAPEAALEFHRHLDRKSTRLNSSHVKISYAVFCL